jgi:hypothetical protein
MPWLGLRKQLELILGGKSFSLDLNSKTLVIFRYFSLINCSRYVPKPRHGIFRITKNNHNILQGVAAPGTRFTKEDRDVLSGWVLENAKRYWLRAEGTQVPALIDKFGPQVYP